MCKKLCTASRITHTSPEYKSDLVKNRKLTERVSLLPLVPDVEEDVEALGHLEDVLGGVDPGRHHVLERRLAGVEDLLIRRHEGDLGAIV